MAAAARRFARRAMAAHPGIEVRLFNPFQLDASMMLARLGAALLRQLLFADMAACRRAPACRWLGEGVELYEIQLEQGAPHDRSLSWGRTSAFSLYAKFRVIDRARQIVGCFNQAPRSRLHHTESWIAVDSTGLAAQLVAMFDQGSGHRCPAMDARSSTCPASGRCCLCFATFAQTNWGAWQRWPVTVRPPSAEDGP